MMFQAGVIGFALGLFAREVARLAGLGGALVAAVVLLLFAREHALPMLVTEKSWAGVRDHRHRAPTPGGETEQ